MPETTKSKYKSPLRKVLGILERGRENWKAKYTDLKSENKYLRNKLRRSEQSQQEWKQKAQAAALENKQLQRLLAQQQEIETLEKKQSNQGKARR
jgi:hypothetical protein